MGDGIRGAKMDHCASVREVPSMGVEISKGGEYPSC